MNLRNLKRTAPVLCVLLALMGCENPTEENITNEYYLDENLVLTLVGGGGGGTNYILPKTKKTGG
jgi:hypothetical protein